MGLFSFLGLGSKRLKDVLRQGAIIIDVRTPQEFDAGKVPESINIPVGRVSANAERIKNMKRVIFVCSSGSRSTQAMRIMKEKGMKEVYDGGSWYNLLKLIKSL